MSRKVIKLYGGLLTPKAPVSKPQLSTKKAKYTGDSARNMRRKASAIKKRIQDQVLSSVPPIQSFFQKPKSVHRVPRNCTSKFNSKNNPIRTARAKSQSFKRKRKAAATTSTKGHKQHVGGAVRKRTRKLSRSTRKDAKAKRKRAAEKLKKKPKLSHLVATVRTRLTTLQKRIRSCARCAVGQSIILRDMHKNVSL